MGSRMVVRCAHDATRRISHRPLAGPRMNRARPARAGLTTPANRRGGRSAAEIISSAAESPR
eukprot:scaffold78402_cov43-Phaeocystis_antarctica.AAC.2